MHHHRRGSVFFFLSSFDLLSFLLSVFVNAALFVSVAIPYRQDGDHDGNDHPE
jgi:hypothetical protein